MAADRWALAVDIRDTSVAAAVKDRHGAKIVEFADARELPSVVFIGPAQELLAGRAAAQLAALDPGHAVFSPKRSLSEGTTIIVGGTEVALTEVYRAILAAVTDEAAPENAPAKPAHLVLIHPADPAEHVLAVLRAAAAAAGLPEPDFLARPVAAAGALAADASPGQRVAVLDVDAASIETAMLRRTHDGFQSAGMPGGLARSAGDDPEVALRQGGYELLATVTSAGCAPSQLGAVCVTGELASPHRAAALLIQILGVEPQLAPGSGAVVLGAVNTVGAPSREPADDLAGSQPEPPSAAGRPWRTIARWAWVIAACAWAAVAFLVVRTLTRPAATPPYRITLHRLIMPSDAADPYKLSEQYPIITRMPSSALQQVINAELRAPAIGAVNAMTKTHAPSAVPGDGFITFEDTVYSDGELLSVKYMYYVHNPGAGDVSYGLTAVTVRMDTGAIVSPDHILTAAAFRAPGVRALSAELQAQESIRTCDEMPGWGAGKLPPVLARMLTPGYVAMNVAPAGVVFSFGDDTISPTPCHPVGAVSFGHLSGLVNPQIATLAERPSG